MSDKYEHGKRLFLQLKQIKNETVFLKELPHMRSKLMRRGILKGVMKTKYKLGLLERLLSPDNNDTNIIAIFEEITEILKKTCKAEATP